MEHHPIRLTDAELWPVPEDVYRADPAHGSTDLKAFYEGEPSDIDPEVAAFGHWVHASVLEPDTLDRFIVRPKSDRRLKDSKGDTLGKAAIEAWEAEAQSAGKQVVALDELDALRGCVEAIRSHPKAGPFFESADGQRESNVRAVYVEDGIRVAVKSRRDRTRGNVVVDLKTSATPSAGAFEAAILKRGYALQGALYADMHTALTGEPTVFVLVVVGKSPDTNGRHPVGIYELGPEWMQFGRRQYEAACRIAAFVHTTKSWPRRYWEHPMVLSEPPVWGYRELGRVEEYAEELMRNAVAVQAAESEQL